MLMFPVPIFVAIILGYLALRAWVKPLRRLLVVFLIVCALQSLIIGLVSGYGIRALVPLLTSNGTLIPPLAWLTFRDTLFRHTSANEILRQMSIPLLALLCRFFVPAMLDIIVPLMFLVYGAIILIALRSVSDLPLAKIEAGTLPRRIWYCLGWSLIASALCDALITAFYATGHGDWSGELISLFSSLIMLTIGALTINSAASGATDDEDEGAEELMPHPETTIEDAEIITNLQSLLMREKIYLDTNLNLSRLAKRLRLPEKRLSAAINRSTGKNLSRYVNDWRIHHACTILSEGQNITKAMLESGFNTKSNFNREFLRVMGTPPSKWRST